MVKRTFSNTCTQILEWLWETMYLHDIVLLYFSYLYLFLLQLCISAYGERSWLLLFLTICVTLSKRKSLTEKCGVLSEVTKQVSPPRDTPTPDKAVQLCSGNGRWAGRSQSTCSWSWKGCLELHSCLMAGGQLCDCCSDMLEQTCSMNKNVMKNCS